MTKKLLVICGTGVATSTVVMGKLKTWLDQQGLTQNVKLYQSKVAEEVNHIDDYDIVVSTTLVPDSIKEKVIDGVPLLTGIGADKVYAEIKQDIEDGEAAK
ncbi:MULTISPECIES: PTS sugar transporter subunit IIB [Lacticaseibacillus]|uniref:PTS galactitol transporter subunit IIB n=3 Tax=Lacticaseibacillus TaxID=2759736 RepID=A0AAN1F0T6_LACCA|nr:MULTISPECIES: PTS sugar transporter subunit IIB [Lacticaseibacillus]ARY92687.1 PTS galactitol transporter subunit IIB [Lacticaseibacillus casei]KAB1969472.1 PTS sugar transporter subunit IIB [Lacticaseibacillus casei]MDE3283704.1 PTS sugar transporter subunit IIB [Lacticaseibacillus casei]WLV77815.1 PTS sugar transporter subunit IIB [Lacticaseibacillus sp. NCIMB 15471]WLV80588.1 PTS sugar transporter subunit IIB [Lacticaseibacillus sp. NCIMB 15473]